MGAFPEYPELFFKNFLPGTGRRSYAGGGRKTALQKEIWQKLYFVHTKYLKGGIFSFAGAFFRKRSQSDMFLSLFVIVYLGKDAIFTAKNTGGIHVEFCPV